MCMCSYVRVYIHTCMYMYVSMCKDTYMYVYVSIHTCVSMCVCACVCVYVHTNINVRRYMCVSVYVCVNLVLKKTCFTCGGEHVLLVGANMYHLLWRTCNTCGGRTCNTCGGEHVTLTPWRMSRVRHKFLITIISCQVTIMNNQLSYLINCPRIYYWRPRKLRSLVHKLATFEISALVSNAFLRFDWW